MSKLKISTKQVHIGAYVVLVLFSVLWIEMNHLPIWLVAITTVPLLAADIFSNMNVELLAYVYTHRKKFALLVFFTSLLFAGLFYYEYPFHIIYKPLPVEDKLMLLILFLFQGAIVGMTLRMLLLNLFADMLRAKDIHKAKLLIIIAWLVFLIMFPVNGTHRCLSSVFLVGLGSGFLFHYLIRVQEKKNAQRNRLKENLYNLITDLKKEASEGKDKDQEDGTEKINLSDDEITAIELYSEQNWKELKKLLNTSKKTDTLFFIRLCMLRKLHDYDAAIGLIKEKLADPNVLHKNYYHLHYALNESEKFNHKGEWEHKDIIFEQLEAAYKITPDCLLTCATYALRIAGEIDTTDEHSNEAKRLANEPQKDRALSLIWNAMKIYEGKALRNPIGPMTGMTIPVTYTFLLESYGYVLLKCGKTRFAKALILQSLFQDPTFSATYLHLAEWYYNSYINFKNSGQLAAKTMNDTWRKSARLNLQIAIEMEKENDREHRGTLISVRAKKLMALIS